MTEQRKTEEERSGMTAGGGPRFVSSHGAIVPAAAIVVRDHRIQARRGREAAAREYGLLAPALQFFKKNRDCVELPPSLRDLVEQSEDEICSIVASALGHYLSEHESFCLSYVLSTHLIDLPGWRSVGPFEPEEIAELLASLAAEYPPSFLSEHRVYEPRTVESGPPEAIPIELRRSYWESYLTSLAEVDPVLSYHDRHTIARLRFLLEEEPRVLAITHID